MVKRFRPFLKWQGIGATGILAVAA